MGEGITHGNVTKGGPRVSPRAELSLNPEGAQTPTTFLTPEGKLVEDQKSLKNRNMPQEIQELTRSFPAATSENGSRAPTLIVLLCNSRSSELT